MLRTSFRQTAALRPLRCFSTSARAMGEGDTGAPPRMGGQGYVQNNAFFRCEISTLAIAPCIRPETNTSSSDAFQRREKANEDYTIRQREKEKLLELKKKLQEQQQHLDRLSKHMYVQYVNRDNFFPVNCILTFTSSDEITKEQGGEQN